jgi:hypothetical protein
MLSRQHDAGRIAYRRPSLSAAFFETVAGPMGTADRCTRRSWNNAHALRMDNALSQRIVTKGVSGVREGVHRERHPRMQSGSKDHAKVLGSAHVRCGANCLV